MKSILRAMQMIILHILLVIADDINGVIASLEKASKVLFEWFENNFLKSNADKCHLLVSCNDAVSKKEVMNMK